MSALKYAGNEWMPLFRTGC